MLPFLPICSVWSISAKHQDRGWSGGLSGQLALAGQRALLWGPPLRRLPDQQPVGAERCPLLQRVGYKEKIPAQTEDPTSGLTSAPVPVSAGSLPAA